MTEFEEFHEWAWGAANRLQKTDTGPIFSNGANLTEGGTWQHYLTYLLFMFTKGMDAP